MAQGWSYFLNLSIYRNEFANRVRYELSYFQKSAGGGMDFDLSSRSEAWREKLQAFFDGEGLPRHRAWLGHVAKGEAAPFMGDLQQKARAAGLWNLGLPEI